ncbi:cell division protein FtsA [Halobacillus litoralis]|uniref:Cell division protein n=1 Tax=Halobacillus litoralis TaxID=45668 RepID=A0A410MGX3_9BACI|nr:pilus assembly protein PilM [Halobacillus litoralis]QAS53915.1 cell division protein [Halobacillus litoralis]
MNEKIFALDIGTRSIVGLILEQEDDDFHLLDHLTIEHQERSMLDGQIHDIRLVADIINKVKVELEKKYGPLKSVCVAAAGRALKTKRSSISTSIKDQPLIDDEMVSHIELSAVQQAQVELAKETNEEDHSHYYCVGYSVLHYYLDGHPIGSLIDQQGEETTVEIIATFLPKVVVESLLSALQRADLEMEALTLEPIAAIQVLIPTSMRRLNVALVDIGAGTSDIAITADGTISAYGMVPSAGDEITEAISDEYLLDFPLAEKAKRELSERNEVSITDILGFEHKLEYEEVINQIHSSIDHLAEKITHEIILLNGKPPKAVMLVGGGSQTPEITTFIAKKLGLSESRVAIRGTEAIQNLTQKDQLPKGPSFVTPLGIAIAAKQNPIQYISLKVNDRTIRLFDINTLTLGDSLLTAGIDIKKLYGKPGHASIIEVNGVSQTLKGTYGNPPIIKLNGAQASLDTPIHHGDVIHVEKGADGKGPIVTVKDLINQLTPLQFHYEGCLYLLTDPCVFINEQIANSDQKIEDHDIIHYFPLRKVRDCKEVFFRLGVWEETFERPSVYIDNQSYPFPSKEETLVLNGVPALDEDRVSDGDRIERPVQYPLSLLDILKYNDINCREEIDVFFEDELITLKNIRYEILKNDTTLSEDAYIFPDDFLMTQKIGKQGFIFQDIFKYVDVDLEKVPQPFQLYRNDDEVSFHTAIFSGDHLRIAKKVV